MKCRGRHFATGEAIELLFDSSILQIESKPVADPGLPYIAPGWIDVQVNGFAGVDFCSPRSSPDEIARAVRALFATGVTRFFPTVITGSPSDMLGALANLANAKRTIAEGAAMEAFHVEGPYISPHDGPRGAHPAQWARRPDIEEFERMQDTAEGNIRLLTLSPEWPEAPSFIEQVTAKGVVVSVGHMRATSQQISDAVRAGATMSTHLGNGADAVLPRRSNYIWDQLADDNLVASFIVDGIHLHHSFLQTALRAKGIERSVLVTDAVMPAGCEPGPYKLGEVDVELHADGSVRLAGGTRLAGSALLMDRAIQNVMQIAGLTLADAVRLATVNPARVCRVSSRPQGLCKGDAADLVRFELDSATGELRVLETYLTGAAVYRRDK